MEHVIIDSKKSYWKKGKKIILTIDTDLLSKRMFQTTSYSDELLPQNSRYFLEISGCFKIFVLEFPPQKRTIKLDIAQGGRKNQFKSLIKDKEKADIFLKERKQKNNTFSLLFPYMVFIIKVFDCGGSALKVYLRNKPLKNLNSNLFKVPIFNIGSRRQDMCQPKNDDPKNMEKSKIAEYAVDTFWNSSFCSDLKGNMMAYACKNNKLNFSNYFWWEYLTVTDPLKILTNNWIKAHSLKYSINSFIGTQYIRKASSEGFEKLKLNFKC